GVIVDCAIAILADRPDASLSTIAEAAEVSRSTLHRHFPGRDELINAVDDAAKEQFLAAVARAQLNGGTALAALVRVSHELLGLGPILGLIFNDHAVVDPDAWTGPDGGSGISHTVIRGQTDGTLDPQLEATWIETCLWTLLFGSWRSLYQGAPIAEVSRQLTRTVEKAFGS